MRRPLLVLILAAGAVAIAGCSPSQPTPSAPPTQEAPPPLGPGAELIYQWVAGGGEGIWLTAADGSNPQQILAEFGGKAVHPDPSPDGQQVAFVVNQADDRQEVWIADADGGNSRLIVPCKDTACGGTDYPSWSPDGTSLAYTFYDGPLPASGPPASSTIRVVEIESGDTSIVASSEASELVDNPRWSGDGSSLVIQIDQFDAVGNEVASFIAVVPAAGGTPERLTEGDLFGAYPDWSPTEDLIVFCSYDLIWDDPPGPSDIYTIKPDGSELIKLTDMVAGGPRATQPSWARDGKGVIVTLQTPAGRKAAYVPADGGEPVAINQLSATHVRELPAP